MSGDAELPGPGPDRTGTEAPAPAQVRPGPGLRQPMGNRGCLAGGLELWCRSSLERGLMEKSVRDTQAVRGWDVNRPLPEPEKGPQGDSLP